MKPSPKRDGCWASPFAAADLVGQPEAVVRRWVDAGSVRVDTIRGQLFVSLDDCWAVARRCDDPAVGVQMADAPGGQIPEASTLSEPSGDIPVPPGSALRTAPIGRARTRGQF